MNWTGGDLQYHSRNRKKDITRKQREHFAKVRASCNGQLSPIRFQHAVEVRSPKDRTLETNVQPKDTPSHEPVRPTRHSSHGEHRSRYRDGTGVKPKSSAIVISSSSSSDSCDQASQHGQSRKASATVNVRARPKHVDPLERQRRSLLDQSDWLGLPISGVQHPSPCQQVAVSGRRHGMRTSDASLPTRKPERQYTRPAKRQRLDHDFCMSGALPDDEIEVCIGPEAFADRRQTTTVQVTSSRAFMPGRSLQSEQMLLDNESVCDKGVAEDRLLLDRRTHGDQLQQQHWDYNSQQHAWSGRQAPAGQDNVAPYHLATRSHHDKIAPSNGSSCHLGHDQGDTGEGRERYHTKTTITEAEHISTTNTQAHQPDRIFGKRQPREIYLQPGAGNTATNVVTGAAVIHLGATGHGDASAHCNTNEAWERFLFGGQPNDHSQGSSPELVDENIRSMVVEVSSGTVDLHF